MSSGSYQAYCAAASRYPLLSKEEEVELSKKLKKGGRAKKKAADTFVVGNLRLVIKIANEYRGMGLDIEDLISEGNVGLQQAAKKYTTLRQVSRSKCLNNASI